MTQTIAVLGPFPIYGLSPCELLRANQKEPKVLIDAGASSVLERIFPAQAMGSKSLLAAKVATVIADHLRGEVFTSLELVTDMMVDRVCDQEATTDDDLRLAAVAFRTLSDQINGYLSTRSAEKRLSMRAGEVEG